MKRRKVEFFEPLRTRQNPDFLNWVSATATNAFMLKDPLLDWLKWHGKTRFMSSLNMSENVSTFMMKKGVDFESSVVDLLKTLYDTEYIDIGGNGENCRDYDKYSLTKKAIYKGIPIIFSGVLWNSKNCTYGIPDILVRSDYLDFIKANPMTNSQKYNKARKLQGNYHYVVVDIKFHTLRLCANGTTLLNEGMMPCYKAQLYIYNEALSNIQDFRSPYAFILGRRWVFTRKNIEYCGESCFDRIGVIDYETYDKDYVTLTEEAIAWVKKVKDEGDNWDPYTDTFLFPNMCNKYDHPYHYVKEEIANQIDEITKVWMCGVKNRKIAHSKGIYKWSDEKCCSSILGLRGNIVAPLVNQILQINRGNELISPTIIRNNMRGWRSKKPNTIEIFVDFETVNDAFLTNFETLPQSKNLNIIFQIGLLYEEENFQLQYKYFVVNGYTVEEERRICLEFYDFLQSLNKKVVLFHWSPAEPSMWSRFIKNSNKNGVNLEQLGLTWIDMLKVFKDEPIVIKGVFDFSLKSIAKKLHAYGKIQNVWDTQTEDGASVMLNAVKALKEAKMQNITLRETSHMKDIIRYNEFDCKTLYEIVKYFREFH